jgi:uncharacterized protein (TIGR03118 family)
MRTRFFPLRSRMLFAVALLAGFATAIAPQIQADTVSYIQTNLVTSNQTDAAAQLTDTNLINPWGIAESATSPFWVSDQGSGVSTLFNVTTSSTTINSLVVTIPAASTPPSGPTGVVFNSTTGFTIGATPKAANFIFSTLQGTIVAWNSTSGAVTAATVSGAVFTGLAATSGNLYAADFKNNQIDVFNSSFAKTASFTDPSVPKGYAPYNVQAINGMLYVEYALVGTNGMPMVGNGNGIVDVFNPNGTLAKTLISGGTLNVPWGIALAPAAFGPFGGDLLVGNFGNGEINAYDPITGAYLGTLDNPQGNPLVNGDLWALQFGNGGNGGNPDALYFTAGIDDETQGLFGEITPTPEPSTLALFGGGLVSLMGIWRRKRA